MKNLRGSKKHAMGNETIRLSPKFKFFLTFHFSLGFSIEYSEKRDAQLNKLKDIAEALNEEYRFLGYKWSTKEFDKQFPLSLQAKHGCMLGTCEETTKVLPKIKNRFSECPVVELASESIREDIAYFDHGAGRSIFLSKANLNV